MKKVGLVSLGCAKNLVDSEIMLASFVNAGYQITNIPKEADVIIVNTCAFIHEAKKEAIDSIIDMAKYRKTLIVTGCLAERYYLELKRYVKEADIIIPFSKYHQFNDYLYPKLKNHKPINFNPLNRVISSENNVAYLRIAEGCNNFCSFCAIPYIRGRYKSRKMDEIIKEANLLVNSGIKELTIIAQDVSAYGIDLKDGSNITKLLKKLEKIKKLKHMRLLYLYPNEITDEFIDFIKISEKVYPYFDIPMQHASDQVLKAMNRRGTHKSSLAILNRIRKAIPHAIFRSTFIVGFPGETNNDFKTLMSFIRDFKFDHAGAFIYSREEGTKAYTLPNQINIKTKQKRLDTFMKEQRKISYQQNLKHIGEVIEGLCVAKNNDTYYFLTRYNAPDDIDGSVFIKSQKPLKLGEYYNLKVKDAFVYDLLVEILE